MNLIPFRMKRSSGMESANLATIADFRNEMNRLLENFLGRAGMRPWLETPWTETSEPGQWLPTIDLKETDSEIAVRAELPGIDPKDIDVSVSEDRLVISGEKKTAAEKTTDGWTHRESHYGSFSRTVPLPEPVDPAKVTARYDKGVLTVQLSKSPSSTSRKVPVLAK